MNILLNLRYSVLLLWILLLFPVASCGGDGGGDEPKPGPDPDPKDATAIATQALNRVWATSCAASAASQRNTDYTNIQSWADNLASSDFTTFFNGQGSSYDALVKYDPILACYNIAFDKVLKEVKETKPASGEVYVWALYNMGYVVKTPSACFAIDIYHKRGAELAPMLDFYALTHVHQDHKTQALIDKMLADGKPVMSNFLSTQNPYTSTVSADYEVNGVKIHTFITNHNNGSTNVPVTAFQITCGSDAGNLVLLHSGDSNFRSEQFDVTASSVDIYIPRYAQDELAENQIIGKVFKPGCVLLSHILELSHADASSSRWPLQHGITRASKLDCKNTFMPFWGDKMVWRNKVLQQ